MDAAARNSTPVFAALRGPPGGETIGKEMTSGGMSAIAGHNWPFVPAKTQQSCAEASKRALVSLLSRR
jgi:hypothetical protein